MAITLPQTPSLSLTGKTALVTGASRGIGMASAVALAQAGAHVHLIARGIDSLKELHQALLEQGHNVDYHVIDITNISDCQTLIEDIGTINILVNCAGMNRPAPLNDITEEDYSAVMDVNVKASLFMTKFIAKNLITAQQSGSIINVSSQMGHVGGPERIVYCASKHAIEGMTKSMALELAKDNIRVNSICPTFIETELTKPFFADAKFKRFVEDSIPLGKIGSVEDIMSAVVFLASDASKLMTGSALMLDGGWTAK